MADQGPPPQLPMLIQQASIILDKCTEFVCDRFDALMNGIIGGIGKGMDKVGEACSNMKSNLVSSMRDFSPSNMFGGKSDPSPSIGQSRSPEVSQDIGRFNQSQLALAGCEQAAEVGAPSMTPCATMSYARGAMQGI